MRVKICLKTAYLEFNADGSKKSIELKILNLQLVGETELNMKRWEDIGVWQTGTRTEPNKTISLSHEGKVFCDQCDKMLEYKVAQRFQKLSKKDPQQFLPEEWCISIWPKKLLNIWATNVKNLCQFFLKKSPNLVTLSVKFIIM